MTILLLLIPLSLLLLGAAIWAFAWAVRRGQFEDLDTPALDILREDGRAGPLDRVVARPAPDEGGPDAG
jgi:cbb3-type cytochrome oxidase maturation protein